MYHKSLVLRLPLERMRMWVLAALLATIAGVAAHAQPLNGTYTIGGGSPNYTTIEAAITDLNARGVSGPVTFAIRTGTYTPPATGYVLGIVGSMSATNTVTFRPDANAIVTVDGSISVPIFDINGGKYFILDGWGGAGVQKRDWKIIQRSASQVIRFINGAQYNIVRNANIISGASGQLTANIVFSTTVGSGNSYNTITQNTIGDSTGVLRTSTGIYMLGTSTAKNTRNRIDDNDILNLGYPSGWIYGFYYSTNNDSTVFVRNRIRVTNTQGATSVFPLYGVYINNTTSNADTIAYNRIWDLKSLYTSATIYGMYFNSSNATTMAVHNNMISLNGDPTTAGVYGMYVTTASPATYTIDYNSIDINGTVPVTSTSAGIYMSSSSNVTMRNNAVSVTRPSTGSTVIYGLYRSVTTGTWTSNYNLVYNNGTGTAFGYYSGTAYATLAAWQTATTRDLNGRSGNPYFLSPINGDLHITSGPRTPVEGNGTPIAGLTTDFDGNARNAATPDIGADEGTHNPMLANDMSADQFVTPAANSTAMANTSFAPVAIVANVGNNTQTNIPVRYRILNASNTVVYSDLQTVASLVSGGRQTVTFNATGNQSGSTTLPAGVYTIELTTQLGTDMDATNNTLTSTSTFKDRLNGIYTINKLGSGVRNYTSFNAAVTDVKTLGVSGPVTFEIASGTYDGTTETFPITLNTAFGMSAVNTVTFKPAAGANPILTGASPASSAIFILENARYFIFDGSNSGGGAPTRNWTIRNTEAGVSSTFWLRNDADLNVVRNCIVQGNAASSVKYISSTTQSNAIILIGQTTAVTGNDSNLVQNNMIGDLSGTFRNNLAVCVFGTSAKPNNGNRILSNDIVNFGNANTYGYGVVTYGEQAGTEVRYNDIHMTIPAPSGVTTIYGLYADYSPGYPINCIYDGNRIYKLTSQAVNWTLYGMNLWINTTTSNTTFSNNFISLGESGDHTIYGLYFQSTSGSTNMYNNSFYMGGVSNGSRLFYAMYKPNGNSVNHRNNVYYADRTGSGYGMYVGSSTGWVSNNNYVKVNAGQSAGYYSSARTTLADFQSASGQDANSVAGTAMPFVDPVNGNLHINPQPVFPGESRAVSGLGITVDYDGQSRDATYPDMGADEGDFNGGGISVVYPNGGEQVSVDYLLDVQFTVNRPLPVRVDFSTNSGATWTTGPTMNAVAGTNTATITTPNIVTSTARVRVLSMKNAWEGDTSNANFDLVLPVFTIVKANGGESLVPTDTVRLQWNSQFTPPTMRLQLDYSTNGGSTWIPINDNIYTQNLPATNYYSWIVPNTPTTQAKIRLKVYGGNINGTSADVFTIQTMPSVKLLSPVGGERWAVGETDSVRWTTVNTSSVRLDYSTDGGASWLEVIPGIPMVPAYVGSYPWLIPATPSENVLVRVLSAERPRFGDTSNLMAIVGPKIQVLSPNGGEEYGIAQPITVTWSSDHVITMAILFSSDGGSTWTPVGQDIPATDGSYTFTPLEIPTDRALVRLVDQDHPRMMDQSDKTFRIRDAKMITVLAPAAGDQLVRGSTTQIAWDAPEVNQVTILYSATGGAPWTTIGTVAAAEGLRSWVVPNQLTSQGRIRIHDASNPSAYGESGLFSIVDQAQQSIHVVSPDGGEKYVQDDEVTIRWTASGVDKVNVFYTTNTTPVPPNNAWVLIKAGVNAVDGQLKWIASVPPSPNYRIRVISNVSPSDISDGVFEIQTKVKPSITLLYPDGGETLEKGSTAQIRWTSQGITGNVKLEWTKDSIWEPIHPSVSATSGSYDWTVPDVLTTTARVRISQGAVADTSTSVFEITGEPPMQLHLISPDGGEQWRMGQKYMITWEGADGIDSLDLQYSLSGGAAGSWETIASVPSSPAMYEWTIPTLPSSSTTVLARIKKKGAAAPSDLSGAVFSIMDPIAGVGNAVTGNAVLSGVGNYPNPFTEQTELRWKQGAAGDVEVRIYQPNGVLVRSEALGRRESGEQRYMVSGSGMPSGLYLYELRVAQEVARGVMSLVK